MRFLPSMTNSHSRSTFIGVLFVFTLISLNAQEFDQFGRVVRTEHGELINYSQSDPVPEQHQSDSVRLKTALEATVSVKDFESISNDSYLKYQKTSEHVVWGTSIGRAGMKSADIDRDGELELLLSCRERYWYVVNYNKTRQAYEITWASEMFEEPITCFTVFEINDRPLIFVGMEDGSYKVFDGFSLQEIGSAKPFNSDVSAIEYADADNDGSKEVILCSESSLVLLDPLVSLGIPESRFDYGGNNMKVGNVDADPQKEIVFNSGEVIEIRGSEVSIQWNYPEEFGAYLVLTDVDADGVDEVVAAKYWNHITCFDADLKSAKWQYRADLDIHVLISYDVDNDGIDEILYGDGQWGSIHCIEGNGVDKLWSIRNPEHGITDIHIADMDGDQRLEICWSGGYTSTGEDIFFVYDFLNRTEEWANMHVVPPFLCFASGDVDNDGISELIAASYESESFGDDGILYVLNGVTKEIEWESDPSLFSSGYLWGGIQSLAVEDYDKDGQKEILVGSSSGYDSRVYFVDPVRKVEEKYIQFEGGDVVKQLAISDLDQNGVNELVVAAGAYIYIVDLFSGETIWSSISLSGSKMGFEIGNVDADTALEIVVPHGQLITVIDGSDQVNYTFETDRDNVSVTLIDANVDGIEDIYCIDESGITTSFEGINYTELEVADFSLNGGYVKLLKSYDIDRNGVEELIIHTSQKRYSSYWEANNSNLIIRRFDNPGVGADLSLSDLPFHSNRDRIYFDDLDLDSVPEMVLGTQRGWSIWSLASSTAINADEFFSPVQELSSGWKLSNWFGYYNDSQFPSIGHPALGTMVIRQDSVGRFFLNATDWGELEIIQPIKDDALYVRHEASRTNFYVSPTDADFMSLGPDRFYDHTFEKWVPSIIPSRDDYQRNYEIAEFLVGLNQTLAAEIVSLANDKQLTLAQEKLREMMISHNTIINYCNVGLNAIQRLIPIDGSFWKSNFENLIEVAENSVVTAQQAIQ